VRSTVGRNHLRPLPLFEAPTVSDNSDGRATPDDVRDALATVDDNAFVDDVTIDDGAVSVEVTEKAPSNNWPTRFGRSSRLPTTCPSTETTRSVSSCMKD